MEAKGVFLGFDFSGVFQSIQLQGAIVLDLGGQRSVAMRVEEPETLETEAFERLTPGRRQGYLIQLNGAKKSAIRVARIAKFRDRVMAGKGVNAY